VKASQLEKGKIRPKSLRAARPQKETTMANLLKMAILQSILSLQAEGWSQRRIARELGVDHGTVRRYPRQRSCEATPANAPTGSHGSNSHFCRPTDMEMKQSPK
jgi:IS30 family transposase